MLTSFLRKKTVDLKPYIRRLCDVTTPNLPVLDNSREEDRFNRSLPVIICPWADDKPVIDQLTVAITRPSDRLMCKWAYCRAHMALPCLPGVRLRPSW